MSDRVCGCHAVTGAAIVTSLQLILLVLTLASTGMVLDRYRVWESYETRGAINATEVAAAAAEVHSSQEYVGFGTFWLFSILILLLSFKYYRPVFVLPNFTALILGCFMNLLAFGAMLGRVLDSSKNYQTNDYEEAILCPMMGLLLLAFFACIFSIIFIHKYHQYLRQRYGHQVPKFVQARPRTTYQDEVY
ncbi:unnamed protein product [Haemonchus placei]|uniref:Lysosomal-associated transmembrane protein 4A n=1 Tax=Haemonchus placei TaxID=6290 RepID=A0A0N4WKT8_HAEPC|nr:unnamed protein product [Haemonchus placei]